MYQHVLTCVIMIKDLINQFFFIDNLILMKILMFLKNIYIYIKIITSHYIYHVRNIILDTL